MPAFPPRRLIIVTGRRRLQTVLARVFRISVAPTVAKQITTAAPKYRPQARSLQARRPTQVLRLHR
jgi:hypothetical protein